MNGTLFKDWKIKAIAEDDREWMTRRVIKPQPPFWAERGAQNQFGRWDFGGHTATQHKISCGYESRYQVGEAVYIKEAIYLNYDTNGAIYRDGSIIPNLKWRWRADVLEARCIPAEAARYFIKITDIRAERLRLPLSPEELKLEGGELALSILEKINGLWVFVYSFKRVEK